MNVLMITGDRKMRAGYPRFDLQAGVVERLVPVYWGRTSLWPHVPAGQWDVVTTQDPFWRGVVGWWLARRLGARFNVQVHTDLRSVGVVKKLVARVVLRRAHSVRVVSEKIKKQVESLGVRVRVVVLPVFVDISHFADLSHTPGAQKTVLWTGRFEPEKDPFLALEVLQKVREHVDARMIMLGAGSLESSLRSAAKGMPVEFPGWQDPARYLPHADLMLSTSKHESWGASIVEALAAGVSVVAPDVGVAREAGAIVAPRERLAEAVVDALQSHTPGSLKLRLLSQEEWAHAWRRTLA